MKAEKTKQNKWQQQRRKDKMDHTNSKGNLQPLANYTKWYQTDLCV